MHQKSEKKIQPRGQSFEQVWDLINNKKYMKAGLFLKSATNRDEDWLFAYGRCLLGLKRYGKALDTFRILENGKYHKNAVLGTAHCYQKMGQFDLALRTIKSIPNWINDKHALMSITCCHEDMGQFDLAVQTCQSVQNWEKDNEVLSSLAHSYQKMGKFDLAVKTYQSIQNLQKNKKALLSLALCYQQMGQFGLAVKTFKSIHIWRKDKQTLLGLARCYQEIEQYDLSVLTYQSIRNWRKDKEVLLGLARCYQDIGQFNLAILTYQSIHNWKNDKHVQLNLARCCQNFGLKQEAKQAYIEILDHFPYAVDAHILFYHFLTNENDEQAKSFLDECIAQWPQSVKLQLFKAECEYRQGNGKGALDRLKQFIQKHPYSTKTYFALIKHLLSQGEVTEAQKLQSLCLQLFQGNQRFFKRIEKLMETTDLMQLWNTPYTFDTPETRQVELTTSIQVIFQSIADLPGKHYLVGSSLLALLEGKVPKAEQDVDLVLTQACPYQLVQKGLVFNPYLAFLYSGQINDTKVDCVMPGAGLPSDMLFHRDFSIAAVFCDANGRLYDFSGHGIQDVKNKVLRTIEDPVQCFEEDMIRLLRAMNYMILEYRPTPEVDSAIRNWTPSKGINFAHLHAVARKHWLRFSNEERAHYLDLLADYGLLKKLFTLDQHTPNLQDVFWQQIQPHGLFIATQPKKISLWKKDILTKEQSAGVLYPQRFFAELNDRPTNERDKEPVLSQNERLNDEVPTGLSLSG